MDQYTRNRLIEEHMSRAQVIAAQVWAKTPNNVELDELRALAYLGLCSAAASWEAYCARNGYDDTRIEFFTPYVTRRMHGAILDELRKTDWLSKTQRSAVKRVQAAKGDVEGLSVDELVALTGMPVDEIKIALVGIATKRPLSLDEGDGIDVEARQVEEESPLAVFLVRAVRSLEPSEQVVLALHYFAGMSLPDIAENLKVPLPDVREHHKLAVSAVYEAMEHAAPTIT